MASWLVAFATMPQTTWLTRRRQATAAPGGRGRLHKGLNASGCDGWLAGRIRYDATNHLADTAASGDDCPGWPRTVAQGPQCERLRWLAGWSLSPRCHKPPG